MCACGATFRVEWMLRSHKVAYDDAEEQNVKGNFPEIVALADSARLLLFVTTHEALSFCENALIHRMGRSNAGMRSRFSLQHVREGGSTLSFVFSRILGSSAQEEKILSKLNGNKYHEEIQLRAGQEVFSTNSHSEAFYVVLKGAVVIAIDRNDPRHKEKSRSEIVSGAGLVRHIRSASEQDTLPIVVTCAWPVGGIFGYVDYLLGRPRHFRTVAAQSGTAVAKVTKANMEFLQNEDPVLDGLVQRVLLQASLLDLANCTCGE